MALHTALKVLWVPSQYTSNYFVILATFTCFWRVLLWFISSLSAIKKHKQLKEKKKLKKFHHSKWRFHDPQNSKLDLKNLKVTAYIFNILNIEHCITLNYVQCSSSLILIQLQTTEKLLRKSMSFCHFCQEKGCVRTERESSGINIKTIAIVQHLQNFISKFIYAEICA